MNNPLRYTDPSGWLNQAVYENGWLMDFSGANEYSPINHSISISGGNDGGAFGSGFNGAGNFDFYSNYSHSGQTLVRGPNGNEWVNSSGVAVYHWNPLGGDEVYRESGEGYVNIYYEGSWVADRKVSNIASGGGANAWDYISNGASVASVYPTISGTWSYNKSGRDVRWTGKNGNYYKLSQVKNNGGYVKSMNYAKNASRLTRGLGNGLTGLSIVTSIGSVGVNLYNDTHNTSVWVGAAIGIGTGILTFVAAPVVVTGAAIFGTAWGVGQLVGGDEINGWIDDNFGYR